MSETRRKVTILKSDPNIGVLADMRIRGQGLAQIVSWIRDHRPECLPEELPSIEDLLMSLLLEGRMLEADRKLLETLLPHDLRRANGKPCEDNELLVELAGRKCYDSWGRKAGRKTNHEYVMHTQEGGGVPHRSLLYHAKMTFFFGGLSRRVSHEFIRNYVGSDRSEEGSPSQESTRFTHHYGFFICPPRYIGNARRESLFEAAMQDAYDRYLAAVSDEIAEYERDHKEPPRGPERKRIYEAASAFLPHTAETSWIWTTNPIAIAKFVLERADPAADLEMQRFARAWRQVCLEWWPNLFPQPWMQEGASP